jgi:hypothetical protein
LNIVENDKHTQNVYFSVTEKNVQKLMDAFFEGGQKLMKSQTILVHIYKARKRIIANFPEGA